MVAKSFQNMEIIGEPFVSNNRKYVTVKNAKTGKTRQVRWYSESEYAKLYPGEIAVSASPDPITGSQKDALGFDKGYITIFKGVTEDHEPWFRKSIARYARWWGWYIISTAEVPADLPANIEPVVLPWDLVGNDNGVLKPIDKVNEGVESILYTPTNSKHIGIIGERLTLDVIVEKAEILTSYYGRSFMYHLRDEDDNLFIWTTNAKEWDVGTHHHIKGTVKTHAIVHNDKRTILTRCVET